MPRFGSLWGIGLVYDRPSVSTYEESLGDIRYVIRAGAFADHLAAVRAGRKEVKLCFMHDYSREIASTRDGSLELVDTPEKLFWRVSPMKARGRQAIERYGLLNPRLLHCSPRMATAVLPIDDPDRVACPRMEARVAELREISIVDRPAFPQTKIFYIPPASMKAAAPKPSPVRPSTPSPAMATATRQPLPDADLDALRVIARFGARGIVRDVRARLYQRGLITSQGAVTQKGRTLLAGGNYGAMLKTGGSDCSRPSLCA